MSTAEAAQWLVVNGELKPIVQGREVSWCAQPGSQEAFLSCPDFEVLYSGNRGGGKTDTLLMDFAQHVGVGHKGEWRGILFRQTFPELADVVNKSKKWFSRIWPRAVFNESQMRWRFPDGEELLFRHFRTQDDYYSYHGHAYPWMAWEELTTWPDDKCYKVMMSCSRSTKPDMPRKYRATTNPYGVGHNWVKSRFRLPLAPGHIVGPVIIETDPESGAALPRRRAIRSHLKENKVLLHSDPNYISRIRAAARNAAELAAWIDGSWDIIAGGMIDDVWNPQIHVIPNLSFDMIPRRWRITRAYDHGQSKPFSVGWWATSNGEPIRLPSGRQLGTIRGDTFRIFEWYGWRGIENEGLRLTAAEIARGIIERESEWGLWGRVRPGVADSSIFDDYEPGRSVAGDMQRIGITWFPADKGPGSRAQGWQQLRQYLLSSAPKPGEAREHPGMYICARCDQWLRTVPVLPRDEKNMDDVDTDAEDHAGDETRYHLRQKGRQMKQGSFK